MTKTKLATGIEKMLTEGFEWKPAPMRTAAQDEPETLWNALRRALGQEGAHTAYWLIRDTQFKPEMKMQTFNGWEDHRDTTKAHVEKILRLVLLHL